jgi:hypothetical protein
MEQSSRHFLEILKHPLVVLIVGAIIGSIVVPRINSRMDRDRRLREMRETRAVAVLNAGLETERRLNLVQTEFESFYKDVAAGNANEQSQQSMRERVRAAYRDFDRDAWWWPYQTRDEVKMLRLVDNGRLQVLEAAVGDYHQALLESTSALDPYWNEVIHAQKPVSPDQAALTLKKVQPQLQQLGERRRRLLEKMVQTIVY